VTLPVDQQRVLDRIEGALHASEPKLASMFSIFTRLNADEPVGLEPLARPRPRSQRVRWLRAGTTIYAFVLVPVMFAMITIGALLSSRAHTVATCETGYSSGAGSPWVSRPWCQTTIQKTTASGARLASCAARIPAIRFVTRAGEVFSPPARAVVAAAAPPSAC
jgi:Protein of unknown function (DUF3040)